MEWKMWLKRAEKGEMEERRRRINNGVLQLLPSMPNPMPVSFLAADKPGTSMERNNDNSDADN